MVPCQALHKLSKGLRSLQRLWIFRESPMHPPTCGPQINSGLTRRARKLFKSMPFPIEADLCSEFPSLSNNQPEVYIAALRGKRMQMVNGSARAAERQVDMAGDAAEVGAAQIVDRAFGEQELIGQK